MNSPAPNLRTCEPCRAHSHERCARCTGCGCERSARHAANSEGTHRAPAAP